MRDACQVTGKKTNTEQTSTIMKNPPPEASDNKK
jgi:hypothetical protein